MYTTFSYIILIISNCQLSNQNIMGCHPFITFFFRIYIFACVCKKYQLWIFKNVILSHTCFDAFLFSDRLSLHQQQRRQRYIILHAPIKVVRCSYPCIAILHNLLLKAHNHLPSLLQIIGNLIYTWPIIIIIIIIYGKRKNDKEKNYLIITTKIFGAEVI